jgi:D-alanine-D-alanine ligase
VDVAIHYDSRVLVEPYLGQRTEINCAVLGYREPIASVCEQPVGRDMLLSYQDKYLSSQAGRGMEGAARVIPAPISAELTGKVQALAVQAFRCIGAAGVARVDFLLDGRDGGLYVNEINTIPGSIAHYLWQPSGLSPEQLVDRLLELAFEAHRDKRKNRYSIATPLLQQADLLSIKK